MVFSFSNRILSLDMGNSTYKFIEARLADRIQILRYGFCQETDLFNSPSPAKKWRKLGCRSKNVVLSFHHKSLFTRELELKAEDELQLHNMIQEEFQRYQIDLKEEYDFDYNVYTYNSESGVYFAKTAGISKHVNREYIDKTICLGLRPKAVDVQVNSVLRVLNKITERCQDFSTSLPCLVLDLGHDNTTAALVNTKGIIALKGISNGCCLMNESSSCTDEYLQGITFACYQLIEHYAYSSYKHELQQGILYGGGTFFPAVISCLKEKIPLRWNLLSHFSCYLPEAPNSMDLNLYANCLGSVLWEEQNIRKRGDREYDRL
jgi:hypothetical protein